MRVAMALVLSGDSPVDRTYRCSIQVSGYAFGTWFVSV